MSALCSTALTTDTGTAGLSLNEFIDKVVHPGRCDIRKSLFPLWMTRNAKKTLQLTPWWPPWKQKVLGEGAQISVFIYLTSRREPGTFVIQKSENFWRQIRSDDTCLRTKHVIY